MKNIFSMLARLERIRRSAAILKAAVAIGIAFVVGAGLLLNSYASGMNRQLSDSLIRLHVVANSDSPEDQALKKGVRDAVLAFMRQELADSPDIEYSKSVIQNT